MADERVDLGALKHSRRSLAGAVTKVLRKYQHIFEEDPSTYDLDAIEDKIIYLDTTGCRFKKVHEDIGDGETEVKNLDKEQEIADTFEENVATTRALLFRLRAMKKAHELSTELHDEIDALERTKRANPEKDHSTSITRIADTFQELRVILRKSTIRSDHQLKRNATDLSNKLNHLSMEDKVMPPTTIMVPATSTPSRPKTVQLPKITLPTFDGDLMKWSTFWSQFQSAVHTNPDLSNPNKLAYLRDAIRDPSTRSLLYCGVENDGYYQEMVDVLQKRFDQTRLIHSTHCRILADIKSVKHNHADLIQFADTIYNAVSGLRHTGQFHASPMITSLVVSSLPKPLQEEWEQRTQDRKEVPDIDDFMEFVRRRAKTISATPTNKAPETKQEVKSYHKKEYPQRHKAAVHTSSAPVSAGFKYDCILCVDKHPLYLCPKFNSMTVSQRSDHLKTNRLCYNCLAPGHKTAECRSLARCKTCTSKHHTMVHRDTPPQSQPAATPTVAANTLISSTPPSVQANTLISSTPPSVQASLTMTSQVLLEGPGGRQLVVRALLDSGSTMTMISTKAAKTLQLPLTAAHVTFSGFQDAPSTPSNALVHVSLSPVQATHSPMEISAAVVDKVACDLPLQGASGLQNLPHLKDLDLADPTFYLPGRIDLLIGEDILSKILLYKALSGREGQPTACATIFGWAIRGPFTPDTRQQSTAASHVNIPTVVESTDQLLSRFWETEEASPFTVALTPEEEQVQHHFELNHTFLPITGRYQVTLPRKQGLQPLGQSRPQALQRYHSNEWAILRKGTWKAFQAVVQEYLDLGHAQLVPALSLQEATESYYLPMHGVTKESSTTTKLHVVFDASAKSSNNLSLNDTLLIGPTLHPRLDTILVRFRTYPVAITGDISKMYREVELAEPDKDLHRFLWRAHPSESILDYHMNRVTFGVAASPYLAVRVLQQTAHDHGGPYPTASSHVYSSFYVDDLLAGANTPEEALALHTSLRQLLLKGGFNLCKWRSSSTLVTNHIDPSLREKLPIKDITDCHSSSHPKALGVEWDSTQDTMSTCINLPTTFISTKRGIISDVATTFDVLGWLAPTIIKMKILYQKLWEVKIDWDEEVPEPYLTQHAEWRKQLTTLTKKKLPRCYFDESPQTDIQLHGFCDASEAAYAAVVYVRATYPNKKPTCRLVAAKTKVSPIKQLSMPRLELCGATLLSKLLTSVRQALNIPLHDVQAWCDSEIVLAWLDGSPKRYKTFVGNRIASILTDLPPATWHHVKSEQNPADCASRGILPEELLAHPLWWEGPTWLSTEPIGMPKQPSAATLAALSTLELKTVICNIVTPVPPEWMEGRYESYHKLICITAWCYHFLYNLRSNLDNHPKRFDSCLTSTEINSAEHCLFLKAQARSFPHELSQITAKKPIRSNSNLLSLSPILGQGGLLRVGGRLSQSNLSLSQVHPPILSSHDYIVKLLFKYKHVALGH